MNKMLPLMSCLLVAATAQATPRAPGNVYVTHMTGGTFVRADLGTVRVMTLNLPAGYFEVTAKLFFGNGSGLAYQDALCTLVSSSTTSDVDKAYVRIDGGQVAMMPLVGAVGSKVPFSVSIDCTSNALDGQVEMGRIVALSVASITGS